MSAAELDRLSTRLLGRRRPHLRVLGDGDRQALLRLCKDDPVSNVFVIERILSGGPIGRGGQMWGWFEGGELVSACWSGANFVLIQATPAAIAAFAVRARNDGRRCMSVCGPAATTLQLWELLSPAWGTPREVRPNQPLMELATAPLVEPDPQVRLATADDLDVLLPACVAMFTEEVGYSPVASDGGWSYRARVEYLVRSERAYVRIDPVTRTVIFKAELGAVSDTVAQVQGVYVDPRYRGQGLATPGMAAVVALTQRNVVPIVSLYVNDYNTRALATYERVGFQQSGAFATVLF